MLRVHQERVSVNRHEDAQADSAKYWEADSTFPPIQEICSCRYSLLKRAIKDRSKDVLQQDMFVTSETYDVRNPVWTVLERYGSKVTLHL